MTVELDGERVEDALPGRQGRLVFAYLTANRFRLVGRGELMDALWPGTPPAAAEASLSALLSKLRRALGADRLEGRGSIRLVLPDDAWVDLEVAADALHRAESAATRGDWTGAWGPARATQHVAARGFLPGEEAPWIDERRRELAALNVRALEIVARASLEIGGSELATAERAARALVREAQFQESGYRYLMRALAALGNTAQALLVYEELRRLLREQLGTTPSPETQGLHRSLLG